MCWVVGNYPESLNVFTKNLLFWKTPEVSLKLDDQQQESFELDDQKESEESVELSPYMQEKITCVSCNEDTARKDLH